MNKVGVNRRAEIESGQRNDESCEGKGGIQYAVGADAAGLSMHSDQ